MIFAVTGAITLILSVVTVFSVRPVLIRMGVVDVPSERSSHTTVAVRGLGIGIFTAFFVGWIIAIASDAQFRGTIALTVVAASIVSGLIGLAEDVKGLSVPIRSVLQLGLATISAWALVTVAGAPWWLIIYAVFFISSYINVANFMDGLNGISGFHGVVAGVAFAVMGYFSAQAWLLMAGVILAVAFAGFLPANLSGRGFMGDIGSYLLGGATVVTSFAALVVGVPVLATIGPMIIYFGDVGVTLVRRVRRGEKWSDPHKEHVYQQIQQMGYTHVQASTIVAIFTAAASVLGLLSYVVEPMWWIALLVAGLAVLIIYLQLPKILPSRISA